MTETAAMTPETCDRAEFIAMDPMGNILIIDAQGCWVREAC